VVLLRGLLQKIAWLLVACEHLPRTRDSGCKGVGNNALQCVRTAYKQSDYVSLYCKNSFSLRREAPVWRTEFIL
jgi:hypothetical protein